MLYEYTEMPFDAALEKAARTAHRDRWAEMGTFEKVNADLERALEALGASFATSAYSMGSLTAYFETPIRGTTPGGLTYTYSPRMGVKGWEDS